MRFYTATRLIESQHNSARLPKHLNWSLDLKLIRRDETKRQNGTFRDKSTTSVRKRVRILLGRVSDGRVRQAGRCGGVQRCRDGCRRRQRRGRLHVRALGSCALPETRADPRAGQAVLWAAQEDAERSRTVVLLCDSCRERTAERGQAAWREGCTQTGAVAGVYAVHGWRVLENRSCWSCSVRWRHWFPLEERAPFRLVCISFFWILRSWNQTLLHVFPNIQERVDCIARNKKHQPV